MARALPGDDLTRLTDEELVAELLRRDTWALVARDRLQHTVNGSGPRCLHQATWSPGDKGQPIAFVCSQELGHDGKHGYADLRWNDDGDMSALNLPPSQFQADRA